MKSTHFLILGAGGQLAREFQRTLPAHGHSFDAPPEEQCNITDHETLRRIVDMSEPDVILNCAAYNAVDAAEDDPDTAFRINRDAVAAMAAIAAKRNAFLVTYSTDYVFDGAKGAPYTEEDRPNPLGIYGRSKHEGEMAVLASKARFLLLRPSWVFGRGTQNFLHKLRGWARNNRVLKITADEVSVPTYTVDMVDLTLAALDRGLEGLYHLTNSGYCSRFELADYYLRAIGADNELLPVAMNDFPTKAKRPGFSAMANSLLSRSLGCAIPDWRSAVDRFVADDT